MNLSVEFLDDDNDISEIAANLIMPRTSVEKGKGPNAVWVFRRTGQQAKYLLVNVNPKTKNGSRSLL
jgi:hypothetical protein